MGFSYVDVYGKPTKPSEVTSKKTNSNVASKRCKNCQAEHRSSKHDICVLCRFVESRGQIPLGAKTV